MQKFHVLQYLLHNLVWTRSNTDWPDDNILELLGTAPLADAVKTVDVSAVWQNAKALCIRRLFLPHHLHTDSTHFVATSLHCERQVHVLFQLLHALLHTPFTPVYTTTQLLSHTPLNIQYTPLPLLKHNIHTFTIHHCHSWHTQHSHLHYTPLHNYSSARSQLSNHQSWIL